MISLTPDQLMGLFLAFIGIFPSILLIRLYFKTKITDYLLFGLFFIDGILVLILDPLAGLTNELILFQLHHISIDTAFFILFIHASRMIWKKTPKIVFATGLGYYLILFIMTALWRLSIQPPTADVLFITLPHSYSTYFPKGAGLVINGVIIYSTAYRYIGEFYRLFSLSFLFYAYYFKTKPFINEEDSKIKNVRRIWLLVWSLFLLHTLSLFPWFPFPYEGIYLVIAAILIFYITFFLPEGLLLSSVQLTRILPLYNFILSQSEKNPSNSTVESIRKYLSLINDLHEGDELKQD